MNLLGKDIPLVSVITAGWNGKEFVYRLLDSLLQQTYTNFEYIYVDDGSTDGTLDIVKQYKTKFEQRNIKCVIIKKQNGGVSDALNEGFKHINGKYIIWPEYDDILKPTSIEKRVDFLEAHSDYGGVTNEAEVVDINDINTVVRYLSPDINNRYDTNQFEHFLRRKSIATAACHMIRTTAFDETHKNRQIYTSRKGPNWQILLPIYYKYKRGFIEEPLCKYVIRKDSISNSIVNESDKIIALEQDLDILEHVLKDIEMSPKEYDRWHKVVLEEHFYWCFRISWTYADAKRCKYYIQKYKEISGTIPSAMNIGYMLIALPFKKCIVKLAIRIKNKKLFVRGI